MDRDVEDILDIIDIVDIVEWAEVIDDNIRLHRRRQDEDINYIQMLNDKDFFDRFHMSKKCFLYVLNQIKESLTYSSERNCPVLPCNQLLVALRFYATGSFHITNGDFFKISPSANSKIIKKVSVALASLRPLHVQLPRGQEVEIVKKEFYEVAKFPNVIGAIDSTHIKIQSVGGSEAEWFRNQKGYFSLKVQTISDARLRIRDIVARWPGSTCDSLIFQGCRAKATFDSGQFLNGVLVGDSGYPLMTYLLTPYGNPETPAQENYNQKHFKTRKVVERQNSLWKRRFPVLSKGLRLNLDTTMTVIVACGVLHNICIDRGEEYPEEWTHDIDDFPDEVAEFNDPGNIAHLNRDTIANNMYDDPGNIAHLNRDTIANNMYDDPGNIAHLNRDTIANNMYDDPGNIAHLNRDTIANSMYDPGNIAHK